METTINYDLIKFDTFELANAITLTEAARYLRGRGGKRPHPDVVRRWANPLRGCVGRHGRRIVLPSVKVGGELLTMRAWAEAFARERCRPVERSQLPAVPITSKQRQRSYERACARLDEAGI